MKSLVLALALFGAVISPQKSPAQTVVQNHSWNDPYWHTHKYGYWNGQKGYWRIKNGKHVFVVVPF
jgi:hypothetical protein